MKWLTWLQTATASLGAEHWTEKSTRGLVGYAWDCVLFAWLAPCWMGDYASVTEKGISVYCIKRGAISGLEGDNIVISIWHYNDFSAGGHTNVKLYCIYGRLALCEEFGHAESWNGKQWYICTCVIPKFVCCGKWCYKFLRFIGISHTYISQKAFSCTHLTKVQS